MDIKPVYLLQRANRAKHYDFVRHSETKKHKKASETLDSVNMVQLPICFTTAVVSVEKKCQAVLPLISLINFLFKSCNDFI